MRPLLLQLLRLAGEMNEAELIYEVDEKGQKILVRSIESKLRAYLCFNNKTKRPVDVWWRDYRGGRQLYGKIPPGGRCDVDSFVTHPWEFTDSVTSEQYLVNNKAIFRPPPKIGGMMFRTNWNVTLNMRSLQHTVLLSIASKFTNPDVAHELDLPDTLASDLYDMIVKLNSPPPDHRPKRIGLQEL